MPSGSAHVDSIVHPISATRTSEINYIRNDVPDRESLSQHDICLTAVDISVTTSETRLQDIYDNREPISMSFYIAV